MPLRSRVRLALCTVLAVLAGAALVPGGAVASHAPFAAPLSIPEVLTGVQQQTRSRPVATRCVRKAKRIRSGRRRRAALRRCSEQRRRTVRRCRARARGIKSRPKRRIPAFTGTVPRSRRAERIESHSKRRRALRRCSRRPRQTFTIRRRVPIRLEMKETEVQILPGQKTKMWTYNGDFPGPTIRVPSGTAQKVEVVNRLPVSAGSMTLHRHGGHQPSSEDGQPADFLIPPGGARDYEYPLTEDGRPERAAFEWYHDHRDLVTARNIWRGLAGMFIVDDELDASLPLPKGEYDVPLMIVDRSFDKNNQLTDPFPEGGPAGGTSPPSDQVVGDHILVNGVPQPHFDVADRRYRLRLLNASNFRSYELRLSSDDAMTQIATESGLLPAPVNRRTITLGPAERAEVVVDFAGQLGQEVVLASSAGPVMQFRINRHVDDDESSVRFDTLRPRPNIDAPLVPTRTWNFDFTPVAEGGRSAWTINGQAFDHQRVDARPPLGVTETWRFTNPSTVRHLVHVHSTNLRLISRNGQAPPPWEDGPKETFIIEPGEVVDAAVRFTDHTGRFVMHCHMLEHEDNGMMNQFEVVGQGGAGSAGHGGGGRGGADPHAAALTWSDLLGPVAPALPVGILLLLAMPLLLASRREAAPARHEQAARARRLPRDNEPVGTPGVRRLGAALLAGVAWTHLLVLPHKLEAPYMAGLFVGAVVGAGVLAWLLHSGTRTRFAWAGSLALASALAGGYVTSRLVGLPQIEHDVGHWLDPIGAGSLALEVTLAALAAAALVAPALRRMGVVNRRALMVALKILALAVLATGLLLTPAASAAVDITPSRVVVTGQGGRATIEREPLRVSFQDPAGKTVLSQVAGQLPVPQPSVNAADPTNTTQGPGTYVPLGFEVGGGRSFQHPGGLFTGNQLGGGTAGVLHAPTRVRTAAPAGQGAEMELETTDPTRVMILNVSPDSGTGFRVRARITNPEGISSFADSFESGPDEAFHGFGGRHNAIDQRGNAFYNWVEEEGFGLGGLGPPQQAVPGDRDDKFIFPNGPTAAYYVQNIMVSSRPYGVLLNQTELTRWRMASDRPDAWQFVSDSASLDYTVAVGDGPTAIRTLTAINGRHRAPPEWAMGMMLKRNVHQGNSNPEIQQRQIRDDIAQMKRYRDLPVTGYAFESWDTLPAEFVRSTNAELKRMGIRPIGYVRAYVNDEGNFDPPGTFDEFVNGGYVVKNELGQPFISVAVGPAAVIDFTNPAAVAFWEKRKIRKMLDLGFDGFMQDFGEQIVSDMRFHNGETGASMHNKYPQVYHAATREILDRYEREHPERGKLWMYTRTGFSGRPGAAAFESANFPGDETSDYNRATGLPSLATDMLSRAVGGAYGYTTDIGGYFDAFARREVDPQILIRWAEWGALSPYFRLHNACCTTGTKMPWAFGEQTRLLYRRQALLHRQAIPYLKTLYREAEATGMPPTRPLWLAFPGDGEAARQDQQWMLGDDVLVAPVVEENVKAREVYFPRGCWESPESGAQFTGPRSARVDAPLGSLPYFFRCGTSPFAQAAAPNRTACLSRRSPIGPRNVGRVRIGQTRRQMLRRIAPKPQRRTRRAYHWCVRDRRGGRVTAVFGRGKRSVLVVTSARAHGNRKVRPLSRMRALRRAYPRRRRATRGVFRASARNPRIFVVRRGRVRLIGVADRRLLRSPRAVRSAVRGAGLR